jgi:CDP-diacylglycerol---glycerol-3-phosphate 3-phosphatidyltransferase
MLARGWFFMSRAMKSALTLTLSRVFLGPLFVALNLFQQKLELSNIALFWSMLAILIYSELSDIFDGVIARRANQVTDLGKLLDPMADSMFRLSVFFTFTQTLVALPLLWVLLLFYRDSLVGAVRNLCALNGHALAARKSGKLKAIIQGITSFVIVIVFGLFSYGKIALEALQTISHYCIAVCALYALGSGIEYIMAHKKYLKIK